jgi:hypothetical protein
MNRLSRSPWRPGKDHAPWTWFFTAFAPVFFLWTGCFAAYGTDSIRVAHINWMGRDKPLPAQFLTMAKTNGYNYVICEYRPYAGEWDRHGRIVGPRPTNFEKRLTQHFQQVDSAGLRLIPHIQTGNRNAPFYHDFINTKIPQQLIHRNLPGAAVPDLDSYVMSPDTTDHPGGAGGARAMAAAFDSLWTMVFKAFDYAKAIMKHQNLDFVHLGYDENCYHFPDTMYNTIFIPLIGLCRSDTVWLRKNGLRNSSTETQIQRLYAANIKMRCSQIFSIANRGRRYHTQVMLWADMFDPGMYVGGPYYGWSFKHLFNRQLQSNNPAYRPLPITPAHDSLVRIRLGGALHLADMKYYKDSIVFCPWIYNTFAGAYRYMPHYTIDSITSNGFKTAYACAGDEYSSLLNTPFNPCSQPRYQNANEFAVAAHDKKFDSKTIGYFSMHWIDIWRVDSLQHGLRWSPDSDYIRAFNFMGIMADINYKSTINDARNK